MFKPTPVCLGARRLQLTSKYGHNYYKGNRVGALGRHPRRHPQSYVIDYRKVRTYVVPKNLYASPLTPFVPKLLQPQKPHYPNAKGGSGFNEISYLQMSRRDKRPAAKMQERLEKMYEAARQAVTPALFTKNNPPPKGEVPLVHKKKIRKVILQRKRSRRAYRKYIKVLKKREAKLNPVPL